MHQNTSPVTAAVAPVHQRHNYVTALITLAALYFAMGFITCLNDTLVPFFKESFRLSYAASSLVQFYFFLTYALVSLPAGKIVAQTGYKAGMIGGFCIVAAGAFLFYPASLWHQYALFLAALFVLAVGIVLLQVAANPYVTFLGAPETAAARLTLVQGAGSVGTTLAPLFGAGIILSRQDSGMAAGEVLRMPYLGIALFLVLLAFVISRLKLPVFTREAKPGAAAASSLKSVLLFRHLRFGILGIFAYVGAEVAIGSFLTNYVADTLAIKEKAANHYVSFYWGGMLAGRLLGAIILKQVRPPLVLAVTASCAILLILFSVNTNGYAAVWSMVMVGVCNSVMFSIIFSLAVKGLGPHTSTASGILSTAITGGAVVSLLVGLARDYSSWAVAFMLPLLCYACILFYALNGYKPGRR
jgi:FHS family L-fucose permease-like MFS transporter